MDATSKAERTPAIVLADIEAKLSTIDGIATSDAFALGGLVREYGSAKANEAAGSIMGPIIEMIGKDLKEMNAKNGEPKKPWES